MKCRECHFAKKGFFKSIPEAYVCIGGVKPIVIADYPDAICRNEKLKDITYEQFMERVEELRRNHLHSELCQCDYLTISEAEHVERWVEMEDGYYPDGFPKTKYKHESCESVSKVYPYCPYCGKKITHIKTIYKEFDFVWKDKFIVE